MTWEHVPVGTIVDSDIRQLASQGKLIRANYQAANVKQACYDLRASTVFFETAADRENQRVEVAASVGYILRPHQYVTAIVMEELELPSDVLGRVLTKGQLFSLGVLPVNTYADPGFEGRLGITLCNISERYIQIRPEQAIAKIEFSRLPKAVAHPYHGQHGFETGIWPVPTQYLADEKALREAGHIKGEGAEFEASYGKRLGVVRRRLNYYAKWVWIQLLAVLLSLCAILLLFGKIDLVQALGISVVANAVTQIGIRLLQPRQL